MTGVIVVLPRAEDARRIKGLLWGGGIPVSGICTTGASAIGLADSLGGGIIVSGYRLPDMICMELRENLPPGFELVVLASRHVIESGLIDRDVVCLGMPLRAHDLVETVDMMIQTMERARRRRREKPGERNPKERELIQKAKEVLMERNHMSEEEAHRYMQKCSMDSGTNLTETAQMVLSLIKK